MLDLSKNDPAKIAEAGFEFNLELPDGTVTDAVIKVRGQFSPAVKAFGKKMYNEFKMKEQRAKRTGKDVEDMSLDEAEDLAVRSAVVRVISWSGLADEGVEVGNTKEEIEAILTKYPFIRNQVMKESDEILNFRHD